MEFTSGYLRQQPRTLAAAKADLAIAKARAFLATVKRTREIIVDWSLPDGGDEIMEPGELGPNEDEFPGEHGQGQF